MAKGKGAGTIAVSMRFDNDVVAWLDRIAEGAATDRGTVCAVMLSMYVDRVIREDNMRAHAARQRDFNAGWAMAQELSGAEPVTREAPPAQPAPNPDAWLTVQEAANAAGLNESTVWRRITGGALKTKKAGNRTLVSMASLHAAGIKPRRKRAKKIVAKAAKKTTKRAAKRPGK